MPPTIRPFNPGDEPHIQRVIRTVFDEYGFTWEAPGYCSDLYEVEEYYKDGGFWVMEEDGETIGTVGLHRLTDTRADLARMYLLPEKRGKGYGWLLLDHAVEEAKRLGFKEMEIWSDKKLTDAHAFYKRAGAQPYGDRICDDPDKSHEWGFLLNLDSYRSRLKH